MEALCVSCDGPLKIPGDSYQGEIVSCPGCATELEIQSVDPLELALAPEPEEDWGE
ncbi:lysine biosynthesis protein LysW [Kitasatospora purpeofusca]|uniref:Lysine biosynthesis protein LysW n=1 Tax=Kitasatospora purpeofusca TaxID=67352 RepID=A0ABZ1TUY0_9ACTN|nr:lysine biosynthesis protein LysW [Kitasatospora purpeofusca]MCX4689508.1 lysine biosynthesis protein LysW [Kitasatospora purpeofusca]MCX4756253.1 lysine biosynthesis protein LysW [Kitasatospora purpeofusca]WSR35916.1 lysine biosynthesis protein LysW [Kitasatospora purpeofusca]WSR44226.1 lysine biosynthesis protein LysW [Kitasatospora purpeofusca]WTA50339.1 lysine biosynthesis protein LysW [Kitasatospora purpeofusca]